MVIAIKFFDVFAGIGGFRNGLEQAGGYECVGFCEIDKYASAAYKAMYDTDLQIKVKWKNENFTKFSQ